MISRYASLRQGLVGAWCPSLGASGFRLIDRSGYGNHGVLTGMDPGTDWVASGSGLALDFDGSNDYVATTAPQIGQLTKNVSVSVWQNLGQTGRVGSLFGLNTVSNINERMQAHCPWSDGVIYWDFGGASTDTRLSVSGQNLSVGNWDHFVFLAGEIGMQIWRNGKLIGSKATPITRVSNSNAFLIGASNMHDQLGTIYYHLGKIDDLRVYSRALTPSEIQLLYTGGRGVGLMPERIKHRRKTTAAAFNRRRRILIGASS
jgi:hypothetical protein